MDQVGAELDELKKRTPSETKAYIDGVKAGVRMYAWQKRKDGTQYIGTGDTTLKEALERIDRIM